MIRVKILQEPTETAIGYEPMLAPVFNFNLTWDETPIEMKQEFADLNELDLKNKSQEYDMRNMWHHARYCRGIE